VTHLWALIGGDLFVNWCVRCICITQALRFVVRWYPPVFIPTSSVVIHVGMSPLRFEFQGGGLLQAGLTGTNEPHWISHSPFDVVRQYTWADHGHSLMSYTYIRYSRWWWSSHWPRLVIHDVVDLHRWVFICALYVSVLHFSNHHWWRGPDEFWHSHSAPWRHC